MLIDFIWIVFILIGLLTLIYLSYWIGCNVRKTRDRHEIMRGCRHKDIRYLDELKHWICQDCGCIFRYLNEEPKSKPYIPEFKSGACSVCGEETEHMNYLCEGCG